MKAEGKRAGLRMVGIGVYCVRDRSQMRTIYHSDSGNDKSLSVNVSSSPTARFRAVSKINPRTVWVLCRNISKDVEAGVLERCKVETVFVG